MKNIRKKWLAWLFLSFITLLAAAFLFLPPKGHIPVLMYHFIVSKPLAGKTSLLLDVKKFNSQMWFLKTFGFRPISLDEYYAIKTNQAQPRGREVLLTFDDGDVSYVENALPAMERYQFPSVNFVVWNFVTKELKENKSVDLAQLKQTAANPLVTIGAHSLTHRNLRTVSLEEARDEIFESKKKLEEFLNKPVHYFCYPEGSFDETIAELTKAAGYRLAFRTSRKQFQNHPEFPYAVQRVKIRANGGLFEFWTHVSGISGSARKIKLFFRQLTRNKANDTLNAYEPTFKST